MPITNAKYTSMMTQSIARQIQASILIGLRLAKHKLLPQGVQKYAPDHLQYRGQASENVVHLAQLD
jgi:hypothetical protein